MDAVHSNKLSNLFRTFSSHSNGGCYLFKKSPHSFGWRRLSVLLWAPYGICQIWKYVNWMHAYICMHTSLIKCVSSGPPCCFGVVRLVLSIFDNFGDDDGILMDFYGRKGERYPKQDSHNVSRFQMKAIWFRISEKFRSL